MTPLTQLTENPLSPDEKKNTEDFGLKVIRSCYNRWKNGYGGYTYIDRVARIAKNRLYAMGKQPCQQFVDLVKIEGQKVVLNLDYSPLAIAKPLLDAKVDRYMQRDEKVVCRAFGPVSQNKKKEDKDEARFKMNYKPAIQALQKQGGVQLEDFKDTDPNSEMELNIQFKTTYKQKEEIIMQMGLTEVFDQNAWEEVIKPHLLMDTFCAGFNVVLTELDGNGWIKTPWVVPESFITSYSEYDDFRDWQWQGRRISMSITEIRQRYPGKFTEEELWSLANRFKGKYGNAAEWYVEWTTYYETAAARPYDQVNCECIDLYYKTLYNLKKTVIKNTFGKENIVDKVNPNSPKVSTEELKSPPYYVAYHGVWIIDTDHVLEWGLAKHMLKPNNNLVEIRSPYAINMWGNTKCRNTPLVETMQPLIDFMQNIWMNTQKIIATMAPDGFNIDVLGLSNIDMGEGAGVLSPMQIWGIYLQTGNQYYRTKEPESDEKAVPPIQPQNNQYSNKLEQLDQLWWSTYKKLQIITGDNNLASGNISNQGVANKALETATELAESPSNYAYKSYLNVRKNTAKNMELLLLDKFFLKDDSFNGYELSLGKEDIEYMRNLGNEDLAMLMFDTDIKVISADAETKRVDDMIALAVEKEQITAADWAMLELIEDQTYRAFMLAQAVANKKKSDMEVAQANSANNVAQATAGAQAKGAEDLKLESLVHQNKMEQNNAEWDNKLKLKDLEGANLIESKIVDAVLSNPDATIEQIPPFIWQRLHITDASMKQFLLDSMKKQAQKQANPQGQQQGAAPVQQGAPQQQPQQPQVQQGQPQQAA